MKAIVLAAGRGRRLEPMGWTKPKCLLEFGEHTLLDHIVDALHACDVKEMVVVVGYEQELVRRSLEDCPLQVEYVVNDDYETTNTINSLYLAREHLTEDFIYFNADILFDARIVANLLRIGGNAFAIDQKLCGDEEVKVVVDGGDRIVRIGKKLDPDECLGEFIGIGTFAQATCAAMVESLRRYNEDLGKKNLFFESAVDHILEEHLFQAIRMDGLKAVEIDTPADYDAALELAKVLRRTEGEG